MVCADTAHSLSLRSCPSDVDGKKFIQYTHILSEKKIASVKQTKIKGVSKRGNHQP